jgi:uncharacterized protein (UPF0335 family)
LDEQPQPKQWRRVEQSPPSKFAAACFQRGLAVASRSSPHDGIIEMPDAALDQGPADAATSDSSAARLKSFIERIERLEEEKSGIAADIKEVYAEAKGTGFEVKIMRQIVRLRKMESDARREQEELLDLYQRALGMIV